MSNKRFRFIWIFACLVLAMGGLNSSPADAVKAERDPMPLFASPTGTGAVCSQAVPCASTTAISNAASGGTIYFATGAYTSTSGQVMLITKSLTMVGGWSGNTSGPVVVNPQAYVSIVDGQGLRRGMVVQCTGDIVIVQGFTFRNGYHSTKGGGVAAMAGAVRLENNRFENTFADSYGGAIAVISTEDVKIVRNTFEGNSATYGGGALYLADSSNVLVSENRFTGNSAGYGSAIHVDSGTVVVQRNVFDGNRGSTSVDIYIKQQPFAFVNNIVVNGKDLAGSAAAVGVYLDIITTTPGLSSIYYNTFSDLSTGLIASSDASVLAINNIFANSLQSINATGATIVGNNNLFWNNTSNPHTLTSPVLGDPAFVDRANGNFHLSAASAGIDAGANLLVPVDFEGKHRPTGLGYDIGADERCFPQFLPMVAR